MKLLWRPTSKPPEDEGTVTIHASVDDEGDYFLREGLLVWRGGKWVSESTLRPETPGVFYITEEQLLASLREQV